MASKATGQRDFFEMIPRRTLAIFLTAVFFTFAPVGMLLVSKFAEERPLGPVLLYVAISGLVAVCWAATFTLSRWFIPGIVILTAAVMTLPAPPLNTTPSPN